MKTFSVNYFLPDFSLRALAISLSAIASCSLKSLPPTRYLPSTASAGTPWIFAKGAPEKMLMAPDLNELRR